MKSIFAPAILLMSRLRIPQKFVVMGLIYLVAMAAVGSSLYLHVGQVIDTSRKELEGIALIKPMTRTMQLLQEHRGLTGGLLGGDESMRSDRAARQTELDSAFRALAGQFSAESRSSEEWQGLWSQWNDICKEELAWSASRSFLTHNLLLNKLQILRRHIADNHALSHDPDIAAHYMLNTAIVGLPEALEKLGQIRGMGTGVLASGSLSQDQRLQMHALITELNTVRNALAFNLNETARYSSEVQKPLTEAFTEFDGLLHQLLDLVQSDIMRERFATRSDVFFRTATVVVNKGYEQLYQTLLPATEALIRARIQRAKTQLLISGGIALILTLSICYFLVGIYYSTVDSIQLLAESARRFASGDLSQRVSLKTHDELRQMGDSVNAMADGFSALIATRVEDEARLAAILGSALDAVIQMDSSGRISGWSNEAEKCFGWTRDEAIGRQLHETIIPIRHRDAHVRGLERYLVSGKAHVLNTRVELEGLHRQGHEFPIELSISSLKTRGGIGFSAFVRDITERKKTEAELRIAAIAFESEEGIAITDTKGATLNVNASFTRITGFSQEEMVGRSLYVMKSDRQDEGQIHAMRRALTKNGAWQGELWGRRKTGEEFPEWIRINAVFSEAGKITNYVVSFSDITQRKKSEETIHKLAFYDSLTGQPNRTLLMDRLKQAMTASKRNRTFGAVLFIDLDHFKTLNDTMGHDKGDMLLQQVARRLVACVREGDTVARLGGDEFVVVLGNLKSSVEEAANQTEAIGEKILTALNQAYQLGGIEHRSSASIGATLFPGHETSIDDLLKQADLAMYKSKETGRNALSFFDPGMQTAVLDRAALEEGLRDAIVRGQFLLHYQAQVDSNGRVVGAEALVRWQHPQRGMVSPAAFIPLAEETGLILPLGHWVMETVCAQLAVWASTPTLAHLSVAVNVSARQFSLPNFVEQVLALLDHYGLGAGKLKLELTESLLLENAEDIIAKMMALKERGVSFSLDDFGTGYSSLSYLKRLPLDQLKIDQSFVRDILTDVNDAAIAQTVVALGQSLGLAVIAEGVETEGQRDFLAGHGCLTYQGYLFSRPLPIEAFEIFVERV